MPLGQGEGGPGQKDGDCAAAGRPGAAPACLEALTSSYGFAKMRFAREGRVRVVERRVHGGRVPLGVSGRLGAA